MHKLAKATAEVYAMNDGKAGYVSLPPHSHLLFLPILPSPLFLPLLLQCFACVKRMYAPVMLELRVHGVLYSSSSFVNSWQATMKIHEVMADNRIRFAQRLNEMSEELANLAKEVDKNRKSVRLPPSLPLPSPDSSPSTTTPPSPPPSQSPSSPPAIVPVYYPSATLPPSVIRCARALRCSRRIGLWIFR